MTVHVNDNPQVMAKGSCTTCIFSGAAASALDATEDGIWEEVLAAHIDLVQAARTPSGFTSSKYGRPPYAFPAALRFQGESLISDCLGGRARWTEPSVSTELDTLFGEDEHAATDYIVSWRAKA